MTKTNQHGFSLIELLVVIMVILVLAAAAAPMMGPVIRRMEMESAARRISVMMVRARSEAMRLNRRVCTGVTGPWGGEQYYILDMVSTDADGDPCNNAVTTYDAPGAGVPGDTRIPMPRTVPWRWTFPAAFWCMNGLPPGYCDGVDMPVPMDRVVFSPRGTMEVFNGATYNQTSTVQSVVLYRWIPGSNEWDLIMITITPYGQSKVFRYGLNVDNTGAQYWGWGDL